MLFIQKTFPPQDLIIFNNQRRTTASNPTYQELGAGTNAPMFQELKTYLLNEQKGLCCYCMQKIATDNCNVEHFLPQSLFPEYETDYFNLYLACRHSHGKSKAIQHCDIRKGNEQIVKMMSYSIKEDGKEKKCEDFFQYVLQEKDHVDISKFAEIKFAEIKDRYEGCWILPEHSKYRKLEDFYRNFAALKLIQKQGLLAIEILNLNAFELKERRKNFYFRIKETLDSANSLVELQKLKNDYETLQNRQFAGVALYFINEKLKKLAS